MTNIISDAIPQLPGSADGKFPQQLSRKFCIDVAPKLIWANSPFVQTLVRSGVSRYLEFKCFHSCNMYLDGIQDVCTIACSTDEGRFLALREEFLRINASA